MIPLENPPENPCFGCGPSHARGLRLAFARDGDAVVTTHTPEPEMIGWPGLFHTGLHFSVLFEACYWGAWELTGVVHAAAGAHTFEQTRLPRVGTPFTTRARILEATPSGVRMVAESVNAEGKPCGRLVSPFERVSRERMQRTKLDLPEYLWRDMAP